MADDTPAFSEAQTTELNKILNGVSANLKRQFETSLTKAMEGSGASFAKLLDEKLSALKPADDTTGDPGNGGKQKGKDLQIATLEKRVNDATEAIRLANEKAAKAEARRREIERSNMVDTALLKAGVSDPFMRELAMAHFDRRGLVQWSGDDEDSDVVWNSAEGQINFGEGLAGWMKGDEAKRFLPPRGAAGSGSRRPTDPTSKTDSKKEISYEDIGNAVLGLHTGGQFGSG